MPASPAYLTPADPPSNRSSVRTPPPPARVPVAAAPSPFDPPAQPSYGAPPLPPTYASSSGQPAIGDEEEDDDLKRALEESAREAARSALPPRPGTGDADSIGGRREGGRRRAFFGR